MTHEKLVRLIARVLDKAPEGDGSAARAERVANAIDVALMLEDDAAPAPVATAVPVARPSTDTDLAPRAALPASPSVWPSILVAPNSLEAQAALAAAPDALRRAAVYNEEDNESKVPVRNISDLIHTLEKETPLTLDIVIERPELGPRTLRLERNIQAGVGFEMVKLSYKHASVAPDNVGMGQISLIADVSFSVYQIDLRIPEAMEEIRRKAQSLYSPRARQIESHTPRPKPLSLPSGVGELGVESGEGIIGGVA